MVAKSRPALERDQEVELIRVLVTGPESSGTSLVSRIFRQAGASVIHRSATYAEEYASLRATARQECDAIAVVFRDPYATMASQMWTGRAYDKLQQGYREIFFALDGLSVPMWVITYESLLLNPQSINPLLSVWGLNPTLVTEQITNENEKHYEHH